MQFTEETLRRCIQCRLTKELQAFVGHRKVCRSCWISLSEEEKRSHILYIAPIAKRNTDRKYWNNKPARPSYKKRKLLRLRLNVKILE